MRIFVAVNMPPDICSALTGLAGLFKSLPATRLTIPANMHVTLAFPGEIPAERLETITHNLATVAFKGFTAGIRALGAFPDDRRPAVIWAGVDPEDSFSRLASLVRQAIPEDLRDKRDFKPHITMARIKHSGDRRAITSLLRNMTPPSMQFRVTSFCLMQSRLAPSGAIHEIVRQYNLE